ncbi:hypothetical protein ACFFS2_08870 [Streptomyces aurantiacus]|uniref:Uncharacterized protein n=1 Tax=Streptomyces aurantiacus TaxID=47760 RepID=A0A7G1NX61_9ACTN|nr:hypothetical protein [Streptomyces aurantiacus]BCL25505.1 hypothetical protein GCM10017557_03640 [Streptomyces aurantiacus]
MVQAWDQDKYNEERATFFNRLSEYRGLGDNDDVVNAATDVWDQLKKEGQWLNSGETANDNWTAKGPVDKFLYQLEYNKAFQMAGNTWKDLANQDSSANAFYWARDAEANQNKDRAGVWGKITPRAAAARAAERGDYILETTPAGKLLNGLNGGFSGWNSSPTLAYVWSGNSQTYAKNTKGTVQADVLEGIANNSVLTNVEWPVIKDKIEAGETPAMRVHILDLRHQSQSSAAWSLKTLQKIDVHSQASFDALPQAPTWDPRYQQMQTRWHQRNQKLDKNDEAAIAAALGDKDKVVVVTDQATNEVRMTSSDALSIQRARQQSVSQMFHNGGGQEALNAYTLLKVDAMLETVAEKERRNSSSSQEYGLRRYTTQGSQEYGSNLGTVPTQESYGHGRAGFTPMNTTEPSYVPFNPAVYSQMAPMESPAAMSSFNGGSQGYFPSYPQPLVSQAYDPYRQPSMASTASAVSPFGGGGPQGYFPAYQQPSGEPPRRQSSGDSYGAYDGGAPLQRVNAREYAPPGQYGHAGQYGNTGQPGNSSDVAAYYAQQRGGAQQQQQRRRGPGGGGGA